MSTEDFPLLMDVEQAGQLLNLSVRQMYELLPRGKVPGAKKIGAQWRINRDVLLGSFKDNPAPR